MNVALVFDDKKTRKPEFVQLLRHLEETQGRVVRLDPDGDMEAQAGGILLDVLLMKTTHLRARQDRTALEQVLHFCRSRPCMAVVDPIESTEVFTRRSTLWAKVRELHAPGVSTPGIGVVCRREDMCDAFCPCICKPDNAESHMLTICHSPADFGRPEYPAYCERLVPHRVLHKVYVVGDRVHVHARSSIGEMPAGTSTFDSQRLTSCSHDEVSELSEGDLAVVQQFARTLGDGLGVSLFGFDIVKEVGSGALYCIDVNLFPGYTSFPAFPQTVVELLAAKVAERRASKGL